MSISGLVVTLTGDPAESGTAVAALTAEPQLRLGPRSGARLAIVAETDSVHEDRELLERIAHTPGVLSAHVVYVEVVPPESPAPPGNRFSNPGGLP
ncbi:chaperone NapD [bacterium]|nr:chaperone NapD [bacterium]